jgi:hypothetical protein
VIEEFKISCVQVVVVIICILLAMGKGEREILQNCGLLVNLCKVIQEVSISVQNLFRVLEMIV